MSKETLRMKIRVMLICLAIIIPISFASLEKVVGAPGAPTLLAPSNGSAFTDNTPTLDWSASGFIIQSQVQVDDSAGFGSPAIDEVIVGSSSQYTCSALSDDTYYWRVRVMDDIDFIYSPWSAVWSFTIDTTGPSAPSLIYPIGETAYQTPTFDWSDVGDAVEYHIAVDDDDTFSTPLFEDTPVISEYSCPILLTQDHTYYWKVRAKDNLDNWGPWTGTASFVPVSSSTPPTLIAPADNSITSDPAVTLDWSDIIGCIGYRLQVDYNSFDFTNYLLYQETVDSEYSYTFTNDYTYYWRVASRRDDGAWGSWSTIYSFVLDRENPVISDVLAIPDTLDDNDNIQVYCNVTDNTGLSNVYLHYRVNSGGWNTVTMSWMVDNLFVGTLGTFNYNDFVEYYITAEDIATPANVATNNNGGAYYSFTVNHNDHTPPLITDIVYDPASPDDTDQIDFSCIVTDANDIQEVILHYRINSQSWNTEYMPLITGSNFGTSLGPFSYNTLIEFYITATDNSPNHNEAIEDNSGAYYDITIGASDVSGPIISGTAFYPAAPTQLDAVLVNCSVTDPSGIENVYLYFRVNGSGWFFKTMSLTTGSIYEATLGPYNFATLVEFYIYATDDYPTHNSATDDNGGAYYSYTVAHSDVVGPTISDIQHSPPVPMEDYPVNITCSVTDDFGVIYVTLYYRLNYGGWTAVNMTLLEGTTYAYIIGPFNYDDTIQYYFYAKDNSPYQNTVTEDNGGAYYQFTVVSSDVVGPTIEEVEHTPSNPTDATAVTIYATVNDTGGVEEVILSFRINGGIWVNTTMSLFSGEVYSANLGVLDYDDTVEYFIIATDSSPNANSNIENNDGSNYSFTVASSDVTGPVIADISQSAVNITASESMTISCNVTDENGVLNVTLAYRIDGGTWTNILMVKESGTIYSITLDSFTAGSFVQYYIQAIDNSVINNGAVDDNGGEYYSFKVLADTTPTINTPLIGGIVGLVLTTGIALGGLVIITRKKKQ